LEQYALIGPTADNILMSDTSKSLSLLRCIFCYLFAAGAGAGCEYILCLVFADCCQTLCLSSSFLSFLFIAFSLPFGKPSLGVAFEAFNHLLDVFVDCFGDLIVAGNYAITLFG
jgi:hypothetical protein